MRNLCFATLLSVAALTLACGGSEVDPEAPTGKTSQPATTGAHEHGAGHSHADSGDAEHPPMPPQVTAFHDVLAPLWHADAGEERTSKTCAALDQLKTAADNMATARPDGVDAEQWTQKGSDLMASLDALAGVCGGDHSTFDATFKGVHEAFHHALELLPKADPEVKEG